MVAGVRLLVWVIDFLYSTAFTGSGAHSTSYLMSTGLFGGKVARGVYLIIHLHLVKRSRMVEPQLLSSLRLHGVMLN
jgi:hypothetical protein